MNLVCYLFVRKQTSGTVPNSYNINRVAADLEQDPIDSAAFTVQEFSDFPLPCLAFRSKMTAGRHDFQ